MKKISLNFFAIAIIGICLSTVSCSKGKQMYGTYYTVSFDAGGGTPVPDDQQVKDGDRAAAPASPAREGYVFLFWSLSGYSSAFDFQTEIDSDISLVARWEEEIEYQQVSWELNGGEWNPADDNHVTRIVKGEMLAIPADPVKPYNTFEGWYKNADLTAQVSFPYYAGILTDGFTLYAGWYDVRSDYFGVWKVVLDDGDWGEITVSPDKFTLLNKSGNSFTIENLTWADTYNRGGEYTYSYPSGYRISGTLTARKNLYVARNDGKGAADLGDVSAVSIYISSSKNNIRFGDPMTAEQEATYGPYSKISSSTQGLNGAVRSAQTAKDVKSAYTTKSRIYNIND